MVVCRVLCSFGLMDVIKIFYGLRKKKDIFRSSQLRIVREGIVSFPLLFLEVLSFNELRSGVNGFLWSLTL